MIPVSYNSKTGMAIMLIRTGKFKHESHSRYGNIKPIPYVLMRHSNLSLQHLRRPDPNICWDRDFNLANATVYIPNIAD